MPRLMPVKADAVARVMMKPLMPVRTVMSPLISPPPAYEHAPAPWVGAVVLISYGVLTTVAGAALIRRRDIL